MAAPPLLDWKLQSRNQLTHDVFELIFDRPKDMTFKAGQYMSIVIPGAGPGGRNLRRAYSIASSPENEKIELCIKLVEGGPGTTYLNSLKVGDSIQAQCPFGTFYLNHDLSKPTVFIGTGTGIAPFRSMILSKEWSQNKSPYTFLLGVRDQQDILYPEIFPEKNPNTQFNQKHVKICLSRPTGNWAGYKGRVTDYLKNQMTESGWDLANSHYYLCGSGAMLNEIKEYLMQTKNVSKEQIHVEKYY